MSERDGGRPERRAARRVVTEGKLPGLLALDLGTDVLQISVGGMMVETSMPLEIGSRHEFVLTIEAEELELSGVVRNCQRFNPQGQPQVYRVGIEFCHLPDRQQHGLEKFVDKKLGD